MGGSRDTPPVHKASSCGETSETILSRSSSHGADYAGNMCQKPLTDLKIVFEDGAVGVNSAALAALSAAVRRSLEACHDVLQLPDVKLSTFSAFLAAVSRGSDVELSNDAREMLSLLEVQTKPSVNREDYKQLPEINEKEARLLKDKTASIPHSGSGNNQDEVISSSSTRPKKQKGRPKSSKSGSGGEKFCKECGGSFVDSWKHRRQCTALNHDIKYVCHECGKGFRRLGAVKHHLKLSGACKLNPSNQREYGRLLQFAETEAAGRSVCRDCGCEYVTRKGPREHRKNCSALTQFQCFSCRRGINTIDGFHVHFAKFPACRAAPDNAEIVSELAARSHRPEFHVCYLCGAQYKTKESMEKHMVTHTEHVEYHPCPRKDCDKRFITQKALDLHLKHHTMPKVICSICGKQVKQGSMPLHMILHTGKKIDCHICGKMFQHKGVLNKHIRSVHDDKRATKQPRESRQPRKPGELPSSVPAPAVCQLQYSHPAQVRCRPQSQSQPLIMRQLLLSFVDVFTPSITYLELRISRQVLDN